MNWPKLRIQRLMREFSSTPNTQDSGIASNIPEETGSERIRQSFDTVLGAYRSQDEAAGRILTAIAFLTTAAVAVLSQTHRVASGVKELKGEIGLAIIGASDESSSEVERLLDSYANGLHTFHGVNVPLAAFWTYLLLALTSAALYLAVLWPAIKRDVEVDRSNPHPPGLRSRLFYRDLAANESDFARWRAQWFEAKEKVEQGLKEDAIRETYLLALRTRDKESFSRRGS
jgi:hypothetical protein